MTRTQIVTTIFCKIFNREDVMNTNSQDEIDDKMKALVNFSGSIADLIINNQIEYENKIVTEEDEELIEQIEKQKLNNSLQQNRNFYIEEE